MITTAVHIDGLVVLPVSITVPDAKTVINKCVDNSLVMSYDGFVRLVVNRFYPKMDCDFCSRTIIYSMMQSNYETIVIPVGVSYVALASAIYRTITVDDCVYNCR